MAMRDHTINELEDLETRIIDILTKMREFKGEWSKKGPEICNMESDMAARSIGYLEKWVPKQMSRLADSREKARKAAAEAAKE